MELQDYYKKQLERTSGPDLSGYKIKIRGGYSETNWLDLNPESAAAVCAYLNKHYLTK